MYLKFEDLMRLPTMQEAEIVGGHGGLDKTINWVHILDEDEVTSWVSEGVLVIRTGVSQINTEEVLTKVIQDLADCKAAGLCLLPGGLYIDEIPAEVIDVANAYELPLIRLSPYHYLADVTYQIGQAIFENKRRQEVLSDLINKLIDQEAGDGELLLLEEKNFDIKAPLYIGLVHVDEEAQGGGFFRNSLIESIRLRFKNRGCPLVYSTSGLHTTKFLFQTGSKSLEEVGKIFESAMDLPGASAGKEGLVIAVGSSSSRLSGLKTSLEDAQVTLNNAIRKPGCRVAFYDKLGLERFFDGLDKESLEYYVKNALEPILGNEEFLRTLKAYLDNDGNFRITSEELYIHISTLRYRIGKIEEALGQDLKDFGVKANLHNALKARDYLRSF